MEKDQIFCCKSKESIGDWKEEFFSTQDSTFVETIWGDYCGRWYTGRFTSQEKHFISNKAPHLITLVDTGEVNRQAHQYLEIGLIQESLSPYSTPVVLAPKKGGEWRMCID